ncbi:hypothetical protein VTN96DRAFT_4094 [Rasamsonia emersonii]
MPHPRPNDDRGGPATRPWLLQIRCPLRIPQEMLNSRKRPSPAIDSRRDAGWSGLAGWPGRRKAFPPRHGVWGLISGRKSPTSQLIPSRRTEHRIIGETNVARAEPTCFKEMKVSTKGRSVQRPSRIMPRENKGRRFAGGPALLVCGGHSGRRRSTDRQSRDPALSVAGSLGKHPWNRDSKSGVAEKRTVMRHPAMELAQGPDSCVFRYWRLPRHFVLILLGP